MSVGDWVPGSYITLSPSTLNMPKGAPVTLSLSWMIVLPSGLKTGFLGPFSYQANPANPVAQETVSASAALAAQEGIPVELPLVDPAVGAQQVNPDGSVTALTQTAQQTATGAP